MNCRILGMCDDFANSIAHLGSAGTIGSMPYQIMSGRFASF